MDLDMVLNELSLRSPAQDVYIARQQMSELLRTMRMAIKNGVNRVLRTHENFFSELLAPEYSIANWRNDANVDREERRYFSSLATKAPYWSDLQDLETKNAYEVSEFRYHGVQADGLGFAYLLEALAMSLCSLSRNFHFAIALTSPWLKGEPSGDRVRVKANDGVDLVGGTW
jgi:hypothetical protein